MDKEKLEVSFGVDLVLRAKVVDDKLSLGFGHEWESYLNSEVPKFRKIIAEAKQKLKSVKPNGQGEDRRIGTTPICPYATTTLISRYS